MKDKPLSPADKNKLRIAKDKRELQRLIKEAEKHLVEGHSPQLYDYLDYSFINVDESTRGSTRQIDNAVEAAAFDITTYLTCADKDALNTVEMWGEEYQQILGDAERRYVDYLREEEDKAIEYVQCAYGDADNGYADLNDEGQDLVNTAEEGIIQVIDDAEDQVNDDLEHAEQEGPGFWGSLWDATVGLPEVMVNIGKMINTFTNLDPDKFIEDNIELIKAQKKLQERVREEGL